jgi:hypothetical protein
VTVSNFNPPSCNRRIKWLITCLQRPASTGTTTPSPTTTSTSSASQPTNNDGGGGLSPGAAAGIGVAATIGLLAVIGITFFLGRRSARHNSATNTGGREHNGPRRHTRGIYASDPVSGNKPTVELVNTRTALELASGPMESPPVELPSTAVSS